MNKNELFEQIKKKTSYLCVGLDSDINKLPKHLLKMADPIFEFNKQIIDATHDLCVAYKPNIAFYESLGPKGWETLEKTVNYIPKECLTIADAKRGDIGNTAEMYARTFFQTYNFDAVTVAPYMGEDSITPFLHFKDKWTIILALTSNKGGLDFQLKGAWGERLFEQVIKKAQNWGTIDNTMFVVGATRPELFDDVRAVAPDNFLLVPGVGTQGGNLEEVSKYGMNKSCGLLVNSSRSIIYASAEKDFASKAREEALKIKQEMQEYLELYS